MSEVASRFTIHVQQVDGFEFRATFDKPQFGTLALDEPPPLGHDRAPNAARVLAAAVGNCLAASLLFSLQRAKIATSGIRATVAVEIVRNASRRLRIGKIDVTLDSELSSADPKLAEVLATFEDFCIVTQSVRHGIEVSVHHV
jgi:organic hydroperoxide reductase OsmC/OhrA